MGCGAYLRVLGGLDRLERLYHLKIPFCRAEGLPVRLTKVRELRFGIPIVTCETRCALCYIDTCSLRRSLSTDWVQVLMVLPHEASWMQGR